MLSGAVALMSLSVKSSLADAMDSNGTSRTPLGVAMRDDIAVDALDDTGYLLGAVERSRRA